jgi:hypothetical protein
MSRGLCLVIDVLETDEAASRADEHLAAATKLLGEDGGALAFARVLPGVGGSPDVALVAVHDAGAASRLTAASPLPPEGRVVCGVDPSVVPDEGIDAPGGYLELVLDRAGHPVPFDHPAVVGVFRDFFARYLPMLGARHLRCEALWHDDVRATGGLIAFRASDDDEARWWAEGDPWRRVAPGYLLRLPEGTIRPHGPPPGPGTQRRDVLGCGHRQVPGGPRAERRDRARARRPPELRP